MNTYLLLKISTLSSLLTLSVPLDAMEVELPVTGPSQPLDKIKVQEKVNMWDFDSYAVDFPKLQSGTLPALYGNEWMGPFFSGFSNELLGLLIASVENSHSFITIFYSLNKTFNALSKDLKENWVQTYTKMTPAGIHTLKIYDQTGGFAVTLIPAAKTNAHFSTKFKFSGKEAYFFRKHSNLNKLAISKGNTFQMDNSTKIVLTYDAEEEVIEVAETDTREITEINYLCQNHQHLGDQSFFKEANLTQCYFYFINKPDSVFFNDKSKIEASLQQIFKENSNDIVKDYHQCKSFYNRHGIILLITIPDGRIIKYMNPATKTITTEETYVTIQEHKYLANIRYQYKSYIQKTKYFMPAFTLILDETVITAVAKSYLNGEPAPVINHWDLMTMWGCIDTLTQKNITTIQLQ